MMDLRDGILFSIKPNYTSDIVNFNKKIEIRKNIPIWQLPVKCYIYCTKDKSYPLYLGPFGASRINVEDDEEYMMNGKIVAEFTCKEIRQYNYFEEMPYYDISDDDLQLTCLTQDQLWEYGKGKTLYGIVISDLLVYDVPKPLYTLKYHCKEYGSDNPNCTECEYYIDGQCYEYDESDCGVDGMKPIKRAPQSWCYARPYIYKTYSHFN